MRRADIISAVLLFALGLVAIFGIIPTYVDGSVQTEDLSSAFMPYVSAALGTIAIGLLLVTRLAGIGVNEQPSPLPRQSWWFIGAAALVLGASFVLMDALGYLAGAAAMVAGFMALARAGAKVAVGSSIAFPLALWLLFDRLLGFPLP